MNTTLLWLKGLVAAFITGAATALTATQGCAVIGTPLDWPQIGTIGLTAGFYGALAYLKQAPVPPLPEPSTRPSTNDANLTDKAEK